MRHWKARIEWVYFEQACYERCEGRRRQLMVHVLNLLIAGKAHQDNREEILEVLDLEDRVEALGTLDEFDAIEIITILKGL